MRRNVRHNPVRSGFDCKVFNLAFKMTFPKKSDRVWWARKLLEAVINKAHADPKLFASSFKAMETDSNLTCGALIKSVDKITRMSNGEDWIVYGLQEYFDNAWKRTRSSVEMIHILTARDPVFAALVYQTALRRTITHQLRKHSLAANTIKQFWRIFAIEHDGNRNAAFYELYKAFGIDRASGHDPTYSPGHIALLMNDFWYAGYHISKGQFYVSVIGWLDVLDRMSDGMMADHIREQVRRVDLG